MKAIEFQSHLENGKIPVPTNCGLLDGQGVRVLILLTEATQTEAPQCSVNGSIWDQIEGSWHGEPLVREDQGDYPTRLELEP